MLRFNRFVYGILNNDDKRLNKQGILDPNFLLMALICCDTRDNV